MRSIYSEYGNNIQDLIELGEVLKHKYGAPGAETPTPEALKNYMDVSITADLSFFNGCVKKPFFFCLLTIKFLHCGRALFTSCSCSKPGQ